MAGIVPIGAVNAALQAEQLAAQIQVAALRAQLDATEEIGEAALRLIESAAIDPEIAQNFDVRV